MTTGYATASRCITMWPPAMQQHPGASHWFQIGETHRIAACDHQLCICIQVHHHVSKKARHTESPNVTTSYATLFHLTLLTYPRKRVTRHDKRQTGSWVSRIPYREQVQVHASMNPSTTSSIASLGNIGRWAVAPLLVPFDSGLSTHTASRWGTILRTRKWSSI